MRLRVDVYDKRVSTAPGKERSKVERGGGFSHTALLIEDCNLGHSTPGGIRLVPESVAWQEELSHFINYSAKAVIRKRMIHKEIALA
jgi:hypothetical protein